MSNILKRAMDCWQREVECEAAELIETGWAPLEAFELAKKRVSERRSEKYRRTEFPSTVAASQEPK